MHYSLQLHTLVTWHVTNKILVKTKSLGDYKALQVKMKRCLFYCLIIIIWLEYGRIKQHFLTRKSSHILNAALAAVISELEQWVTQKAFLYFCLGLKTVLVSFLFIWSSPIPADFDDSSRILVYLEKCEQPDTVLKTQTAQTATWMKKMMNFSCRSRDTHTALYRTSYK